MAEETSPVAADVVEPARSFIEALNARDPERLRTLVTEDVAFPNQQGRTLRGYEGVLDIVRAAEDAKVRFVPEGAEQVDEPGGKRISIPVRVAVRRDELRGRAVFELRGDRIASFEVITDDG